MNYSTLLFIFLSLWSFNYTYFLVHFSLLLIYFAFLLFFLIIELRNLSFGLGNSSIAHLSFLIVIRIHFSGTWFIALLTFLAWSSATCFHILKAFLQEFARINSIILITVINVYFPDLLTSFAFKFLILSIWMKNYSNFTFLIPIIFIG